MVPQVTFRLAQPERSFLTKWVIATSVGWIVAAPLVWFIAAMLSVMELQLVCQRETIALCFEYGNTGAITSEGFREIMSMALFSGVVFGLTAGAVIGSLQWLVIRRRVSFGGLWVFATAVGGALIFPGILAGLATVMIAWQEQDGIYYPNLIRNPLSGLLIGFAVGTAQWAVLRGYARARWWILVSMVVWIGILGNGLISTSRDGFWSFVNEVSEAAPTALCLAGPLVGAFTGVMLVWIFRKPLHTDNLST